MLCQVLNISMFDQESFGTVKIRVLMRKRHFPSSFKYNHYLKRSDLRHRSFCFGSRRLKNQSHFDAAKCLTRRRTNACDGACFNPFMPTGAFNIYCPRDAFSLTANVERTGRHKWVNAMPYHALSNAR